MFSWVDMGYRILLSPRCWSSVKRLAAALRHRLLSQWSLLFLLFSLDVCLIRCLGGCSIEGCWDTRCWWMKGCEQMYRCTGWSAMVTLFPCARSWASSPCSLCHPSFSDPRRDRVIDAQLLYVVISCSSSLFGSIWKYMLGSQVFMVDFAVFRSHRGTHTCFSIPLYPPFKKINRAAKSSRLYVIDA